MFTFSIFLWRCLQCAKFKCLNFVFIYLTFIFRGMFTLRFRLSFTKEFFTNFNNRIMSKALDLSKNSAGTSGYISVRRCIIVYPATLIVSLAVVFCISPQYHISTISGPIIRLHFLWVALFCSTTHNCRHIFDLIVRSSLC